MISFCVLINHDFFANDIFVKKKKEKYCHGSFPPERRRRANWTSKAREEINESRAEIRVEKRAKIFARPRGPFTSRVARKYGYLSGTFLITCKELRVTINKLRNRSSSYFGIYYLLSFLSLLHLRLTK